MRLAWDLLRLFVLNLVLRRRERQLRQSHDFMHHEWQPERRSYRDDA